MKKKTKLFYFVSYQGHFCQNVAVKVSVATSSLTQTGCGNTSSELKKWRGKVLDDYKEFFTDGAFKLLT